MHDNVVLPETVSSLCIVLCVTYSVHLQNSVVVNDSYTVAVFTSPPTPLQTHQRSVMINPSAQQEAALVKVHAVICLLKDMNASDFIRVSV